MNKVVLNFFISIFVVEIAVSSKFFFCIFVAFLKDFLFLLNEEIMPDYFSILTQIRKLYEPELYNGSTVFEHFDALFGPRERRLMEEKKMVCAVGFEPNPTHKRL